MSFQTTIYGKYFLLDRIAVGGMAEVFKAKTYGVRGFERLLVIKRILPHLSKDEEFVEMFIDEAKITVELSHANICQVTDLGKIGDNYFIAMEFINGKDLRAILKKCHVAKLFLSIPQAIHTTIEILQGLEYAHSKVDTITGRPLQLIHRDISPQNIMISYHGEVKIVDFGIAKTESKLHRTHAGVIKGKFGYMSPEQASVMELDHRTDIFSTGILLYEMVTGRRLFLGEDDFKTLEAIKACEIPPPSKYQPELSPELEAIILKSLAKEREDRFSSAQEMQIALAKIFYTAYPDYTAKDLAGFLKKLFAAEIEQEQEALRRALDSLPPAQVAAVTSAAETEGSFPPGHGEPRISAFPPTFSDPNARPNTVPSTPKVPIPPQKGSFFSTLKTLFVFVISALVVGGGAWYFLRPAKSGKISTPTPVATQAPKVAGIEIVSKPLGATLYIDGEKRGITPLILPLHPKSYNIRLERNGFKTYQDRLFVTRDQPKYTFTLKKDLPVFGSLYIDSDPPGAEISHNGNQTDQTTPATVTGLKVGQEHIIVLERDGYDQAKKMVLMKTAKETVTIELTRKAIVTLRIKVTPEKASIFLDGKERGRVIEDLEPKKTYLLKVSSPGYVTETREIRPIGSKYEVDIDLKKVIIPMGILNIGATPWANLIVDGKLLKDTTPLIDYELPVGTHEIIFRHPDYQDIKKTVKIRKGENPPVIIDFRSSGN